MRRFLLAGTGSGCGKTTVTCAILQALVDRGIRVSSFKCGPDYIDPMFHREVIGTEAHNLDSYFCRREALCSLLTRYGGDVSVIEGVMGFYDGEKASAHAVSCLTNTPVVLVVNCRGMSDSIGAVMQGFLRYREKNHIVGFVFNRLPEKLVPLAKSLCRELGTLYLGYFPACPVTFESRHLGLVTTEEISQIRDKMKILGELAERCIDLDALLGLPEFPLPSFQFYSAEKLVETPVTIAVARDRAFCFQYPENLDVLRDFGCELLFFSPLNDRQLPPCDGLYLCGGYPELYAQALSENRSMRTSIRDAMLAGLPTIAECGGFMYLHDELETAEHRAFPMVGVIHGKAFPTGRLQRFGYLTMTALTDNLLCDPGGSLRAHEFHYWDSESCGGDFHAEKRDGRAWECAHANAQMYAGFPHLYWYDDRGAAERFARACAVFREEKNGTDTSDRGSR